MCCLWTVGRAVHTLHEGEVVVGVTVLDGEIYVLRPKEHDQVEVYDIITYRFQRFITVMNARVCTDMTSCEHYRCVYIADHGSECVHRLDRASGSVALPHTGLSITNLMVCR